MANLSSKTGFTPVQTRVNFSALNTATSVQDFAAYDSQELSGFVYVTTSSTGATTLRAAVKVTVNKNGAGTYEIVATDIAGDDVAGSPMVSFSLSGSMLQATLSSGITGTFSSGYIQYQLNAPALGGNFPLSIDGSQVLSGTVAAARLPEAGAAAAGIVSTGTQTIAGAKTFNSQLTVSSGGLSLGNNTRIVAITTFVGNVETANYTDITIPAGSGATGAIAMNNSFNIAGFNFLGVSAGATGKLRFYHSTGVVGQLFGVIIIWLA